MLNNQHPLQDLAAEIVYFYRHGERIDDERFPGIGYNNSLVLRVLDKGGRTVSELARVRHVARQTMSQTVEDWVARDLVRFVDNPRHKKARLLLLTEEGETLLRAVNFRELQFIRRVERQFDLDEVKTAVAVIRKFHSLLDTAVRDDR